MPFIDKSYVYALIRRDIPIEQQLVQVGHAALEAGRFHYGPDEPIASFIVLEVPDKADLLRAAEKLTHQGVAHSLFFEPDFDMGHSALASRPVRGKERNLFRRWPLWQGAAIVGATASAPGG
jgi:hypothetical protein